MPVQRGHPGPNRTLNCPDRWAKVSIRRPPQLVTISFCCQCKKGHNRPACRLSTAQFAATVCRTIDRKGRTVLQHVQHTRISWQLWKMLSKRQPLARQLQCQRILNVLNPCNIFILQIKSPFFDYCWFLNEPNGYEQNNGSNNEELRIICNIPTPQHTKFSLWIKIINVKCITPPKIAATNVIDNCWWKYWITVKKT